MTDDGPAARNETGIRILNDLTDGRGSLKFPGLEKLLMRLLMGVPSTSHVELARYEIEGLRELGVEIDTLPYGSRSEGESTLKKALVVAWTARAFRRALQRSTYDLVYLNSTIGSRALVRDAITLQALRSANVPVFIKMHGSDSTLLNRTDPVARILKHIVFNRAAAFGLLSSEEIANFHKAGVEEHKLFRVKNVVNPSVYKKDVEFKQRIGLSPGSPMVLFAARFIPSKGLIDLIRACAILRDRGYSLNIVCLGDGPSRSECEAEVECLGIQRLVRFPGFVPEAETKPYYANADMVVLPTWEEGFPMTVFQAVAAGVPVITTRIRAAADYLHEPENCLWVEPRNPGQLADKMQQLLDSPALMEQMAHNNLSSADNYSKETVANEFLEVYRTITSSMPASNS